MTQPNALTPLSYAIADDIVTRLITMTDAERRQVATMLAELAPNVATALVEAGEFYGLARQVIEALGLHTGMASIAAENELRTAQQKISDLEAENKRIKAELLAARASPHLTLSENQLA